MWIAKSEYDRLIFADDNCKSLQERSKEDARKIGEYRNKVEALEAEVQRLARLLSEKTPDCNVGPWCDDCRHIGRDASFAKCPDWCGAWHLETMGEVTYCKKHLHELCPEFEQKRTGG